MNEPEFLTVADLVEFLQTQPQDIKVAYRCHSETVCLEERDILLDELCEPRPDGWVQNKRPDMPSEFYLVFPGN